MIYYFGGCKNLISRKEVKSIILAAIFLMAFFQFKVLAQSSLDAPRVDIDVNKEWTVKFNSELKPSTVNNTNISITDENNIQVPVIVSLSSDSTTAIISPKTGGYDPGEKYNLFISDEVESALGEKLRSPVHMEFTTVNNYSDGTNYSDLPSISSNEFEYTPLLSSQKQGFFLNCNNWTNIQYRIFVKGEQQNDYTELTDGYTSAVDGKVTAVKTLSSGTNGQEYKAIIYVKRTGVSGAHKDENTEYDNYFIDYFRCVESLSSSGNTYTDYDTTLDQMVNTQLNSSSKPVFVENTIMNNAASKNQIKYYTNPDNFIDYYGRYQFLKLTYSEGLTEDSLNSFLEGKKIFEGKGQAFLDAAKKYNINVCYLVSHAMLETGYGTSQLANGGALDSDGNYLYGKPVYNFFGIGAVDEDPVVKGTEKAYENGWFTPEEAIDGGAKWISEQYINNPSGSQDTLYKMRWNPTNPAQHQYATDIAWAYKQISNIIKSIQEVSSGADTVLEFEIPRFKK
jgi:beta-N-acetylglucosaminidase